jgi:hypothetical protein
LLAQDTVLFLRHTTAKICPKVLSINYENQKLRQSIYDLHALVRSHVVYCIIQSPQKKHKALQSACEKEQRSAVPHAANDPTHYQNQPLSIFSIRSIFLPGNSVVSPVIAITQK